MALRLAIGNSDFRNLRKAGAEFVDKSMIIDDLVGQEDKVVLLPRPRRFGKTLAMTMLHAWFDRDATDREALFGDLAVWQAGAKIRASAGRHPVIYLTFKDIKAATWAGCREHVALLLAAMVRDHADVIAGSPVAPEQAGAIARLRQATATVVEMQESIKLVSELLYRATGEQVVILIDEYDTPIHAGWLGGYYDDVVDLFRGLFSAGLKDNTWLYRGVLTGILRIAKESLFSGINNLSCYTVLSSNYASHFGFTPHEVADLTLRAGLGAELPGIEAWYNGYRFGGQVIYNPWSVLNFLRSPADGLRSHWVNTAGNEILERVLVRNNPIGLADWEALLHGGAVGTRVDEHMVLRDLDHNADAAWSLLLHSGYLTALDVKPAGRRRDVVLAAPNAEVRDGLRGLFEDYIERGLGGATRAGELGQALLRGDEDTARALIADLARAMLSYHDTAARPAEAVCQAFVLGLLAVLERTHEVTSNREAGFGRYDVLVAPRRPGDRGAVLELKVPRNKSVKAAKEALAAAREQLRQRDYAAALRERGAGEIAQWGIVFDGKKVWIERVE